MADTLDYYTDLEMNVLQVAIDHMVEHLEDLLSDSDFKTNAKELAWLKADHQERLEAAKRLKERLACAPTTTRSTRMPQNGYAI